MESQQCNNHNSAKFYAKQKDSFQSSFLPFDGALSSSSSSFFSSLSSSTRLEDSLEGVMALSSPMQTVSDIDDRNNDLG
jgi:hypothetical protein